MSAPLFVVPSPIEDRLLVMCAGCGAATYFDIDEIPLLPESNFIYGLDASLLASLADLHACTEQGGQEPVSDAVSVEFIRDERAAGWPTIHPQDYCWTCGARNPSWTGIDWVTVVGSHGGIECPRCFMLREPTTHWRVTRFPERDPGALATLAEFLRSISGLEGDENERVASCLIDAGYSRAALPEYDEQGSK